MKKLNPGMVLFALILPALILTGCTGKPAEASFAPQDSEGGVRDKYEISLSLDEGKKRLSGSMKLLVHNTSDSSWDELCLRDYPSAMFAALGELTGTKLTETGDITEIDSVSTGSRLEFSRDSQDKSAVFVKLEGPLAPGEKTELEIQFYTDIPKDSIRLRWSEPQEGRMVFDLANFYPVLAIYENGEWQHEPFFMEGECFYSKCADYSLTLTVPEDYVVAASGDEEKVAAENGKTTWEITAENMRDMAITTGNYLGKISAQVGGAELSCYYFDNDDGKAQGEIMLESGKKAMELFADKFGDYPYSSLDLVMTGDFLNAIEYPAIVRIGDQSQYLSGEGGEAQKSSVINSTVHEVAHQWFYAWVGNDPYKEPWLDESLASFCELIYQEATGGEKEAGETAEFNRSNTQSQSHFLNVSYSELGKEYISTVYFRGQAFLYDLRELMGEEAFYDMLKGYCRTWGGREAHTKDFIKAVYSKSDTPEIRALLEKHLSV